MNHWDEPVDLPNIKSLIEITHWDDNFTNDQPNLIDTITVEHETNNHPDQTDFWLIDEAIHNGWYTHENPNFRVCENYEFEVIDSNI